MPTVRGKSEVSRFMAQIPALLEERVLRGAGRAGAKVIATEAKARSVSSEVAAAIKTKVNASEGRIVARVAVNGRWPNSLGLWLEYGTDPHFIRVDDSQRGGFSVGKINEGMKEGRSLVIGGQFVGDTVFHPGARPHPFLRPALDAKGGAAVAAAQAYIDSRVSRSGIAAGGDGE